MGEGCCVDVRVPSVIVWGNGTLANGEGFPPGLRRLRLNRIYGLIQASGSQDAAITQNITRVYTLGGMQGVDSEAMRSLAVALILDT